MLNFNIPPYIGNEQHYIQQAIQNQKISGDGKFTKKCREWFKQYSDCKDALLTTSCTHALEMAGFLINIKEGDEVIMPSYTFVSTANAFAIRGAKIIFVDIQPDTMNIDENLIEAAITKKTRAIVPVHYAGVSCNMDKILEIAKNYNLYVIEDAAQAMMSYYKGKPLGSLGNLGAFSFHETKNYSMGEGGLLLIQDENLIERAEIIREKGTNRSRFLRGEVDKYTWVDLGSSYLPSELNAAYLYAQLAEANLINNNRLKSWNLYHQLLQPLEQMNYIKRPVIPESCTHNAHMYYIKVRDLEQRTKLLKFLRDNKIYAVFHYIPLHSSEGGKKYSAFCGEDTFTTSESEKLVRLPMYYGLEENDIKFVVQKIEQFFEGAL
ncbi:MAG: dTDP-4-amino-4,6-dideoxygalactose transaminase [Epulopiscium sp. Nele67-Bin004]|nr:MAG: dTDP-4-amino-4,6-dideoxygalactose transaminase [Epulopiscium sp. Nele67-Bin004]